MRVLAVSKLVEKHESVRGPIFDHSEVKMALLLGASLEYESTPGTWIHALIDLFKDPGWYDKIRLRAVIFEE